VVDVPCVIAVLRVIGMLRVGGVHGMSAAVVVAGHGSPPGGVTRLYP
jgi:hypothetical protein